MADLFNGVAATRQELALKNMRPAALCQKIVATAAGKGKRPAAAHTKLAATGPTSYFRTLADRSEHGMSP
jgi:hypothetical protein